MNLAEFMDLLDLGKFNNLKALFPGRCKKAVQKFFFLKRSNNCFIIKGIKILHLKQFTEAMPF